MKIKKIWAINIALWLILMSCNLSLEHRHYDAPIKLPLFTSCQNDFSYNETYSFSMNSKFYFLNRFSSEIENDSRYEIESFWNSGLHIQSEKILDIGPIVDVRCTQDGNIIVSGSSHSILLDNNLNIIKTVAIPKTVLSSPDPSDSYYSISDDLNLIFYNLYADNLVYPQILDLQNDSYLNFDSTQNNWAVLLHKDRLCFEAQDGIYFSNIDGTSTHELYRNINANRLDFSKKIHDGKYLIISSANNPSTCISILDLDKEEFIDINISNIIEIRNNDIYWEDINSGKIYKTDIETNIDAFLYEKNSQDMNIINIDENENILYQIQNDGIWETYLLKLKNSK